MKVLILGSKGILSSTLINYLKIKKVNYFSLSRSKNYKKNYYLKNFYDFKKLENKILEINPDFIVNCIGITKYFLTNKNKKIITLINSKLPHFLSKICALNKIYFIHISTDCVFNGSKGNYGERSTKNSIDFYGISKGKGEVKNKYTATIRTSFIGPENNSSNSLLNWFLKQTSEVNGYSCAFFNGITSLELSKIIYNYFINKKNFYNKIINIGGIKISKFELLKEISLVFGKKIKINKFKNFQIDRSLNIKKFLKISKYKIKPWNKMLIELKKFMVINNYNF